MNEDMILFMECVKKDEEYGRVFHPEYKTDIKRFLNTGDIEVFHKLSGARELARDINVQNIKKQILIDTIDSIIIDLLTNNINTTEVKTIILKEALFLTENNVEMDVESFINYLFSVRKKIDEMIDIIKLKEESIKVEQINPDKYKNSIEALRVLKQQVNAHQVLKR